MKQINFPKVDKFHLFDYYIRVSLMNGNFHGGIPLDNEGNAPKGWKPSWAIGVFKVKPGTDKDRIVESFRVKKDNFDNARNDAIKFIRLSVKSHIKLEMEIAKELDMKYTSYYAEIGENFGKIQRTGTDQTEEKND